MRRIFMIIGLVLIIAYMVVDFSHAQTQSASSGSVNPQSAPAPLPIETFIKYDIFSDIMLSPSGKYAVYLGGKKGRSLLAFMTVEDKKIINGISCPDGFEISYFHWISDRRIIYKIAKRQTLGELMDTGDLYAVDVDGTNSNIIFGYNARRQKNDDRTERPDQSLSSAVLISPLLNDEQHILIKEMPWQRSVNRAFYNPDAKPIITLLDSYTGEKQSLGTAPYSNAEIITDQQDRVRFAIGLNSNLKYAASWKPNPEGDWVDFDLPGFREDSIIPLIMSEDGGTIFFIGTASDSLYSALFHLDLATHKSTKIFGLDDKNISKAILDLTGKRIIGVQSYVDKPVTYWLDKNDLAARIRISLETTFPGQTVQILSANKDGSLAVIFVNSDINPGDYYLFDTKAMKAAYLQPARDWINPAQMRPKQPFTFKARDGLTLNGYITCPYGDGPYPMVVIPHGGPDGIRDTWEFDSETQLFANRGYAVLQVNFRGSGGFGDDFRRKGYNEWGGKIQDDITDATRWAIDQKIAIPDRICIYGFGFGAYSAFEGVIREPILYRCAIGYAGVYDLELLDYTYNTLRSKLYRSYWQTTLSVEKSILRAWSPVDNADKIQVPVFLVHSKEKRSADFEDARLMKRALRKYKKIFEWMEFKGTVHAEHDEATRKEVYERILAFMDKYLKGPTS
jgi:dipeptidyl aminopeptidase/acylaminoacyl peptidase